MRQVNHEVMSERVNWIAELDLAPLFDTMPHSEMLEVLAERIAEAKFLRLMARMLKAGGQPPGGIVQDALGSPQGSIVSPVIANAFLDQVVEPWFVQTVRQYCRGYCALIWYADDALAVCELETAAQRFMRVLPKRLGRCGLRLHPHTTHVLAFGKIQAWRELGTGRRLAPFDCLGFPHYWGRSRSGKVR